MKRHLPALGQELAIIHGVTFSGRSEIVAVWRAVENAVRAERRRIRKTIAANVYAHADDPYCEATEAAIARALACVQAPKVRR